MFTLGRPPPLPWKQRFICSDKTLLQSTCEGLRYGADVHLSFCVSINREMPSAQQHRQTAGAKTASGGVRVGGGETQRAEDKGNLCCTWDARRSRRDGGLNPSVNWEEVVGKDDPASSACFSNFSPTQSTNNNCVQNMYADDTLMRLTAPTPRALYVPSSAIGCCWCDWAGLTLSARHKYLKQWWAEQFF